MFTTRPQLTSLLFAVSLLISIALALALRLPDLERRPMHSDEAVQAAKTGVLFDTHQYAYDPHEFHGPTLYYFTLPPLWMSSVKSYADSSEWHYRVVPVVFGTALVLLLLLVGDGMGRTGVFCAAVFTAVSPAMVFYSRYYIQETPFVFFSFALIACGWRYVKTRGMGWAIMTGVGAGLLFATKETSIIVFFSMGVALVGTYVFEPRRIEVSKQLATHAILALLSAALISVLFYSSFFTHARGPLDSILTFQNYFTRSGEPSTHDKPWTYYVQLLAWNRAPGAPIWTEAFILILACIGSAPAFFDSTNEARLEKRVFARFIAIYTLTMLVGYSLISYKTPWCALGFLHGSILLAGIGAAKFVEWMPHWSLKTLSALVFAAGAAHLGWQAVQANGRYASDPRNPYVYVHTSPDAVRLCKRIEDLAAFHPDGNAMVVKVMVANAEYWPMPWYLRKLKRVGFWNAPPARLEAPVLVASNEFASELALELKTPYQKNQYGVRPGVLVALYVDAELWKKYLATRQNGIHK